MIAFRHEKFIAINPLWFGDNRMFAHCVNIFSPGNLIGEVFNLSVCSFFEKMRQTDNDFICVYCCTHEGIIRIIKYWD